MGESGEKKFLAATKSFGREKIFVGESGEKKFLAATKKFWARENFCGRVGREKVFGRDEKFWAREKLCRGPGREKVFGRYEIFLGERKIFVGESGENKFWTRPELCSFVRFAHSLSLVSTLICDKREAVSCLDTEPSLARRSGSVNESRVPFVRFAHSL